MKIAIASLGDPRSVKTWSGIPHHIIDTLEKKGHEILPIALTKPAQPWYYNWYRRFYYLLFKRWFLAEVEPFVLKRLGQQLDKAVAAIRPDIVISIHGDFLSYANFPQLAVFVHDTTFASLVGYYPEFSNLTKRSIRAGNSMYQRALNKSSAAVFSASWATTSALQSYQVGFEKVHTFPLGANLDSIPSPRDVSEWTEKRCQAHTCNFLFLGVNWIRKGGPDALRFVKALNGLGIVSRLIVVGCEANVKDEDKQYVEQVGFLRKNVPAEKKRLENLLKECQALLLPSNAECYGCVYCEANAYGLPALGRDTGGIPEIIKDGENGMLLGGEESPEAFAERWARIWNDSERYLKMANSARAHYEDRLNYDVFTDRLLLLITDKLKSHNQV